MLCTLLCVAGPACCPLVALCLSALSFAQPCACCQPSSPEQIGCLLGSTGQHLLSIAALRARVKLAGVVLICAGCMAWFQASSSSGATQHLGGSIAEPAASSAPGVESEREGVSETEKNGCVCPCSCWDYVHTAPAVAATELAPKLSSQASAGCVWCILSCVVCQLGCNPGSNHVLMWVATLVSFSCVFAHTHSCLCDRPAMCGLS